MYNPSIFSRSIKGLWTLCSRPNLRLKRKLRIIEWTIMRWILTVSTLMMRGCAVNSLQFTVQFTQTLDIVKSNSNSDSPTSIQLNALPFAHKVVPIGLTYLVVGTLFWKYHQPILGQVRWRTLPKNANSQFQLTRWQKSRKQAHFSNCQYPLSKETKNQNRNTIHIKMEKSNWSLPASLPCPTPWEPDRGKPKSKAGHYHPQYSDLV